MLQHRCVSCDGCAKDARGLHCGHLCSSKRRHFEVPVGRGYFKAEGIDIELRLLSISVQHGENTEQPPGMVLASVLPRPPTHSLPVSNLLTLS